MADAATIADVDFPKPLHCNCKCQIKTLYCLGYQVMKLKLVSKLVILLSPFINQIIDILGVFCFKSDSHY
jgi:hypothetical protein